MVLFILTLFVIGIIAGYLARLLVPGPDPMSFLQTVILGIIGSFVGGFLGKILFDAGEEAFQPAGIIGSIVGAIIVVLIWRAIGGRKRTTSDRRGRRA